MTTLESPVRESSTITAPAEGVRARRRRWSPSLLAVAACGALLLALYLFALVAPYPLTRFVGQPLLDLGKIGGYSRDAGVRFAAILAALWLAYLLAGTLAPLAARSLRPLAYGGAVLFSGVLLWLYPITAADIFNYILYGLAQHRGANPLVTPPAEVVGSALLDYSAWPAHPSPYGPVWQWLAYGVTALTGERLLAGVLAFKLLLAGCHLLNVALVERIVAASGAARPDLAALLYGWNPFILYETVGNGHNDVLVLTALLLALWAFTRLEPDRSTTLPFVALAALTKVAAALWAPVLALGWWLARPPGERIGARVRRALGVCGLCALLVVLLYWRFWEGERTFLGLRRQADLYTTSFGGLAMIALTERRALFDPGQLLKAIKALILAALALTLVLRRPRSGAIREVLGALFDVTLVYLLVGALWFQPWYLVPLLGLAPLLDGARRALAVAFALGATGSYLVYFYVWPELDWTPDRLLVQGWAVAVTYTPVALTLAALAARRVGRGARRVARAA